MDGYDQKFADMQKYIPFLEAMIARLTEAKEQEPAREMQLVRMQQLRGILLSSKRKLKLETLQKCESVLQRWHSKVGKGAGGLNFPTKKRDGSTEKTTDASGSRTESENLQDSKSKNLDKKLSQSEKRKSKKKMDETPASPSPPASPSIAGTSTSSSPIIIPTERKHDYTNNKVDSKPASPELCETVSTAEPIIIPTERKAESTEHSKKLSNVLNPSKGGRKFSISEKSRPASTEKELLKIEFKQSINKPSGSSSPSKKSTPSIILPPRPETSGPPLSMEDLAELLDEATPRNVDKKVVFQGDKIKDKQTLGVGKSENDKKDGKIFDQRSREEEESERRWEEIDKHIVKMTSRKNFSSVKNENIKSDSKPPFNKKTGDQHQSHSPTMKNSDRESRYSDNYERHPRQSRELHNNPDPTYPKPDVKKNSFSRHPDMHQQRMGQSPHIGLSEPEFRRENMDFSRESTDFRRGDFYDMGHNQGPMHHSSGGGYCQPQWGTQNSNMRSHSNTPYQNSGPPHQEMWNMGPNGTGIDHMPNRFTLGPSRGGRPNDMNFTEDIPLSPPTSQNTPIPPLMSAPPIFPNNQYRPQFPSENRPFEPPAFDRSNEFSHGATRSQQWESPAPNRANDMPFDRPGDYPRWDSLSNRSNESSYDRPDYIPARQSTSWEPLPNRLPNDHPSFHEGHRGRGMETSYGRGSNIDSPSWNRSGPNEGSIGRGRGTFPTDRGRPGEQSSPLGYNRRNDWERSSNDPTNRFSNRDPRFRLDTPQPPINVTNPSMRRDPRLAKDTSGIITIDTSPVQRDPRRRNSDSKEPSKCASPNITPQMNKAKPPEKGKDTKLTAGKLGKTSIEKMNKDTMHSPLECLYGVIDTTAKTGKGYGLQKFKIPKIKRPETVPRPPTPPKPSASRDDEDWNYNPPTPPFENKAKQQDEKKVEVVTSTTNENVDTAMNIATPDTTHDTPNVTEIKKQEVKPIIESDSDKDEVETKVDTSTLTKKSTTKNQDAPTAVTEEFIESVIKKSLESIEGKKILEQAKLLQKLTAALQAKKYKKIQKIIESESESSSSDAAEAIGNRKKVLKKKKSAIISDSSEEESLAERIQDKTTKKTIDKNKKKKNLVKKDEQILVKKDEQNLVKKDEQNLVKKDEQNLVKKDEPTKSDTEMKEDHSSKKKTKEVVKNEEVKDEKLPVKKKRGPKVKGKGKVEKPEQVVEEEPENKEEKPKEIPDVPTIPDKKPRKAARRRNSLEMLQEDIREMFISEGVVTATGHRMCRLLKEAEQKTADVDDTTTHSIYTSSTERNDESHSDEEATRRARSKNRARSRSRARSQSSKGSKTNEPTSKQRGRKKNPKRTVISKEIVSTSDEDESFASNNDTSKQSSEFDKSLLSKSPEANTEELTNTSTPTLRRSERVAMKEPRVLIEKTELSKIDSSKIMFDTSSDESFGIDVSGLTAAVDISLHSERQSAENVNDSLPSPSKKSPKKTKKLRKETGRKKALVFDDDISIASDASSSNASSIKKRSTISTPIDNNEEVITNILESFVDDKNKGTSVDKNSDVENEKDEETVDGIKKPPIRRKKKKNTWQLGIVPRQKKKRNANTSSTEESPAASQVQEKNSVPDVVKKDISKSLNKSSENNKKVSKNLTSAKIHISQINTLNEVKEVEYPAMTVNQLTEYAWTGQERYKCLLCSFNGKNIVHHYKSVHPKNEIMISRLTFLDAKRAIDEAKDNVFIKLSEKLYSGPNRKFCCRFCVHVSEGQKQSTMEIFYEHCTTHTGEYRYACKGCGYQTPARSSIRSHYYKVCRKSFDNVLLSFTEDPIPSEEYIPGYLCSLCHFLQLKQCNLEKHISKQHKDTSNVEIIKISMSSFFDIKDGKHFAETIIKEDTDIVSDDEHEHANEADLDHNVEKSKGDDCQDISLKSDANQDEGEYSPSKKLSAFVCPPDVDNKEVEIQLERKKKMQELLVNYGRKFQKDSTNGLSIIDKLKNKMTTIGTETGSVIDSDNHNETIISDEPIILQLPVEISDIQDKDPLSIYPHTSETFDKETDRTEQDLNEKVADKKMKDPLTSLHSDIQRNEIDINDAEPVEEVNKNFESDSSDDDDDNDEDNDDDDDDDNDDDDVSETEISTDVNSLLKDAEKNTTSTKIPMMTTIQRLAAQLQNAKSFTTGGNEESIDDEVNKDSSQPESISPKVPIITSFGSLVKIWDHLPPKGPSLSPLYEKDLDSDSPKNFIRLRRLSGDKLSNNQFFAELRATESSDAQINTESSADSIPESQEDHEQSNADEECSFLKIENVVSLAPTEQNTNNENQLITDIRKAVATTSVKATGLSVLKKPTGIGSAGPNILKKIRPVGKLEGLLSRLPAIAPAPARGGTLASKTKNYKVVKVVRGLTVLKPKESTQSMAAPKLKTADAYQNMLSASKLRHLYKCMARACSFSTDSADSFGMHYQNHTPSNDTAVQTTPYDYQKCPYCSDSFTTWEIMKAHYKKKHSFCSFQCSYCFYRAFTQSYVELHQAASHQGKPLSVILGMRDYHPTEVIDRREFVLPFVCKHACDKLFYVPEAFVAHLNNKHEPPLSIFNCHVCPHSCLKAKLLVTHYKLHGIYKFQCLFCLFGADGLLELHNHLSIMHCNRPPKILERSLPPSPVRDKDVLLQLIIRNLDESYKCTELKLIAESVQDMASKQPIKIRPKPRQSAPIVAPAPSVSSAKSNPILPRQMKIVSHSEVIDLLDQQNSRDYGVPVTNIVVKPSEITLRTPGGFKDSGEISVIKASDIQPESTQKTLKITGKSATTPDVKTNIPQVDATTVQLMHPERELEVRYANEQIKTKIVNAIDPLSLPEEDLRCDEEFININLLDNPDILKSVEQSTNKEKSEVNNTTKNEYNKANNDNNDNNDDSDIEILECIQHVNKTLDNTEDSLENISSVLEEKIEEKFNSKEMKKVEETLEINVVKSLESLDVSIESNASINAVQSIFRPKTLEDIKDSGLTGVNLYKCGYPGCSFITETPLSLRSHIKECTFANEKKEIGCLHCSKKFVKIGYLLEHLKLHGLKRFGCALCKYRCAVSYQATAHMKMKHKINTSKLIPADPSNPAEDGLFTIHPLKTSIIKIRGKKGIKIPVKDFAADEKTSFNPSEIDSLPRQAIYNREVQCAVCPYTTKVRTNIIRHLQLHAKDETVPETGPVNPVPCLDKKERMFDKMVNLASSSHQNGRMGGVVKDTPSPSEVDSVPKYIPEHRRYVCSVTDCNYLTVDETMLRYHLKALHSEEHSFRCPHCPAPITGQDVPIDKMGVHLKMHDTKLYKCSHCNYHHYHRYVVERHLSDRHHEKRPFVKVVREIENTENTQQPAGQEDNEDGPADKDGNYWKCNICEYKCVYKNEMVTHAQSVHNEKAQFKCSGCPFKTTARMSLDQHIMAKHVKDEEVEYTLVFERIKGTRRTVESSEQTITEEPFDTTPLWRRDMPRIRHIRGILLEDEPEARATVSESPGKAAKRKSEAELSSKPGKIVKTKSISLDSSSVLENKSTLETKNGESLTDLQATYSTKRQNKKIILDINSLGILKEKLKTHFYENKPSNPEMECYGKPMGSLYVCSLCPDYRTKFRQDIKEHLFRDFKYWRWHCKTCGYSAVSQAQVTKHASKQHKNEKPNIVAIEPNSKIESWVQNFLSKQWAMMRGITEDILSTPPSKLVASPSKSKQSIKVSNESENNPSTTAPTTIDLEDSDTSLVPSSTITSITGVKTVDLTEAITSMQNTSSLKVNTSADVSMQNEDDDDDDDDEDALVIDSKDDVIDEAEKVTEKPVEPDTEKLKELQKTYVCKHCNTRFGRWRGFKLHVQVNHLKRLGFLCPYCDRSTNSEGMMSQHIRAKHPGCPEKIIQNPAAGGPELTDEFWEEEYGLVIPRKAKRRKRKLSVPDVVLENAEAVGSSDICNICGFTAINFTGLKAHMRAHANKHTLKCTYCSFTANSKSDVWQHSEINHPLLEWKAEEINALGSSEHPAIHVFTKNSTEEDYSKDIEEEPIVETNDIPVVYGCFYCNLRSSSLDTIKVHWNSIHKDYNASSKLKTGVTFRYKEISMKYASNEKLMKCGYCPKKGSVSQMRIHCRVKHPNVPINFAEAIARTRDIWICQWCNETCETQSRTAHHNMFHSHLPAHFKIKHEIPMIQKGYVCPICKYVTITLSKMKKHISKHYDNFKCKRCEKCFPTIALATQHSTKEHEGCAANIEGFVTNIDLLMASVSETDCTDNPSSSADVTPSPNDMFRNLGVAKKSTTKQIIKTPIATSIKAVARKSTNPLPRYPPGVVFDIGENDSDADSISSSDTPSSGFSYYGCPREPVDLSNLNTIMAVGGAQMKVKCVTLAQIINIDPSVELEDEMKKNSPSPS